ncbi:MAG: hypothetical protein P4L59_08115 [Desulfosporosinus sp.]|nr:hypothetical protein [Desulfosporosinus sp.]
MRDIKLIDEIDYNYKALLLDEKNKLFDGDHTLNNVIKLVKSVYTANEIVDITPELESIATDVTNSFIETFESRGGATNEQINFANETAKIVFGDLKENIISVIPAPCGFGKSSITLELLQKIIDLHIKKITTDGIIIVTDRLESLRDTEKELDKLGLGGYTYVLEGWNQEICINKKIKQGDAKVCAPANCNFYMQCKISKQQKEQEKFPILLITNARLRECGDTLKRYAKWEQGDRTILLIDERPEVLDVVKVSKELLNKISTILSKLDYETTEEKTVLENKFKEICELINNKMQKLRNNYKRFIVSNVNNDIICKNDTEFMELWDKYMRYNNRRELDHIHTVLTVGGFYVYQSKIEFICTIGSRDLKEMYCDTFKTIIFDGTALYDPQYLGMYDKGSIKYLDIENSRIYDNLTINVYSKHKLTQTTFREKNHLVGACASFINNKMRIGFVKQAYVVTYQKRANELLPLLKHTGAIPTPNDSETYYFGNTKGNNSMQNCTRMFMLGWNTMPDFEYVIQWLSFCVKWDKAIRLCSDLEKAVTMSEQLEVKDRSQTVSGGDQYGTRYKSYEFGYENLNQYKYFAMVTDFYQEVHRTKLRNYSCKDNIEVHIFAVKSIICKMIKQLFPKRQGDLIDVIDDELSEFAESKADNRKNKVNGYDEFMAWVVAWDGSIIKASKLKEICKVNDEQFKTLKKNRIIKDKLATFTVPKRGFYSN